MAELAVSAPRYSFGEEVANSLIHGLGIVLSIGGLATLVAFAALSGAALAVVSCAVFGTALVLAYTASTLYHAIPLQAPKRVLRHLDHVAIYLLIAGTYTPFTLVAMQGVWGWGLFAAIWTLAVAGFVLEFTALRHVRWLMALVYVGMGWLALVAFEPLTRSLETGGLALLLAGGVVYTLGVPFYLWRKLPYHHAVWHLFVLAGSVLHFLAILLYVVPDAPRAG